MMTAVSPGHNHDYIDDDDDADHIDDNNDDFIGDDDDDARAVDDCLEYDNWVYQGIV